MIGRSKELEDVGRDASSFPTYLGKIEETLLSILFYIVLTLSFSVYISLACESIRFSSLFAAGDVPWSEERGETDAFAG